MKRTFLASGILFALLFTQIYISFAGPGEPSPKAVKNENYLEGFPDIPKFDSTSNESVLLRYKFRTGKTVKIAFEILMNNHVEAGGRDAGISMTLTMDASYTVKSVEANGDAWAILTFTRMTMKSSGPDNFSFDSDKDAAAGNPNLQALKVLINTPIPVKVSALGKLLDMDKDPIQKAIQRAGAAAKLLDFEKTTDQALKGSFIQLSPSPVKAGDIYDAGTIIQPMEGVGEMVLNARYKVLTISGDKKQVLLQPVGKLILKPLTKGPLSVKLNSGKMDGWILFDLEKGNIVRSEGLSAMDMSLSQGAQTMRLAVDTKIKCRSGTEGEAVTTNN